MAKYMTSSVWFGICWCLCRISASSRLNDRDPLYGSTNNEIQKYRNAYRTRTLQRYEPFYQQSSGRTRHVWSSGYSGSRSRDMARRETATITRHGSPEIGQQKTVDNSDVYQYDDMTLSEEACYRDYVISCRKGTVTSLGYPESYTANITCRWLIKAPKGQVVHLNFADLSLDEGDCVTLSYRGSAVQHLYDPAVVLCGDLRPQKFTSVGHEVEVTFSADDSGEGRGMLFHYNVRQPVPCEDLIELEGISGSVSSPGYPRHYEAHINCTWRIITPPNTNVVITFSDLAIEYARSCDYDVLTLYDGAMTSEPKLAAYCGHRIPDDVIASTNVILLVLTSDITSQDRGFSLEWRAV